MSLASSSILDVIGVEIIGVMSPVSICMLTVVLLIYSLSQQSSPQTAIRTAANLVYTEDPSDSVTQKLEGSLLNALVFIALVAAVTFLLVLLYYYNFTSCLTNYMRLSSFFVLSSLGGSIFLSLLQRFSLPLDPITSLLLLLNFSALGTISLFSPGFPIILRQCYMVALGVIVALWFAKLPEWTTWSLLIALALYDLAAVLAPGGPLKLLVELASSRGEDLPALVYESRPAAGRASSPSQLQPPASIELQTRNADAAEESNADENEQSPLVGSSGGSPSTGRRSSRESEIGVIEGEEMSPLVEIIGAEIGGETEVESERGIKLGLGDFIFYSVLVGRAAMYDLMTVYACYLAIISGLGCTLVLLSVYRRALPALPISIALGTLFYFLTRMLMEPFVVGASTNLLMF